MSVSPGRVFWATGLLFTLLYAADAIATAQQAERSEDTQGKPPQIASAGPESISMSPAGEQPLSAAASAEAGRDLPDDPSVSQARPTDVATANASPDGSLKPGIESTNEGKQTKRILYMVPNFRSVDANTTLPRQTVKDKFMTATMDSVDYSSFVFYAFQGGIGWMGNSYPEFGKGFTAYGQYYWHVAVDSTSENYWVEFLIPSALHQDTRYYTMGKGSFTKRFVYAFTRTMVTRTDGGGETVNLSEMLGAGAAAGMSNLYYPPQEQTFVKTYQRWITNFVIDGGTFVFKEFWPDLNNSVFHEQD